MLCPCAPTPIFFMPLHWLVPQHPQHPLSDDLASSLGCPPDPLEHRRQMQRIWCWMAMAIKIEVFLTSWVEVEFQIYILKYHIFLTLKLKNSNHPKYPNQTHTPNLRQGCILQHIAGLPRQNPRNLPGCHGAQEGYRGDAGLHLRHHEIVH